jgi:TetR/AcrR family transcriptional regulator
VASTPTTETSSPRATRRRQRIALGREQILDEAEEAFGAYGYHNTGLKDVAEKCEYSVGSIYSFFESKRELFWAVMARRGEVGLARMQDVLDSDLTPDDMLIGISRVQIELYREFPAWARMINGLVAPNAVSDFPKEDLAAYYAPGYEWAMDVQSGLIKKGQRAGIIRPGNPRALARLFSGLTTTFHQMDSRVNDSSIDYELDEFLLFLRSTFFN